MSLLRTVFVLVTCAAIAACSTTDSPHSRIDYKKAVTVPPLDVPPPLNAPTAGPDGVEVPSNNVQGSATLLPQPDNVRVARDGDVRWLVVQGSAETFWPKLHDFWIKEGLEIQKEDARIGVIQTQWAENRADIPESYLRGIISKAAPNLYSASTRDMYRMRVERGVQPGTTEIYLSHYGVEQVKSGDEFKWQPRPSDPELVTELLNRLMLFLGVAPERAQSVLVQKTEQAAQRARIDGSALVMNESFARSWRLVGIALDRVGLVVEDLDRAKGIYFVRQTEQFVEAKKEKRGWFASAPKIEEKKFRLLVQGDEESTRVTANNDKGEPLSAEATQLILTRLQEQLR